MYIVEKLQAFDYFLKQIILDPECAIHKKEPKLLISLYGTLWHGDFIVHSRSEGGVAGYRQLVINESGQIEPNYFTDLNPFFYKVRETYRNYTQWKQQGSYYYNDLYQELLKNTDLSFLFNFVTTGIDMLPSDIESSPLFPHLHNAKSLDGKLQVPFMNLAGEEKIRLVSIVETQK